MSITRRQFIKTTALAGGGLAIGFSLGGCEPPPFPGRADDLRPNAFLQLNSEGEIVLQLHKAEMGQGVYTGMATLAAEELGLQPADLKIVHAHFHPAFKNPDLHLMATGGSTSLRTSFLPLREAAAVMAALIRHAGSYQLGVSEDRLVLREGRVIFEDQSLTFAELLPVARNLPLPRDVTLRHPSDFRFIGRFDQRLDSRAKVTGRARFGLDAQFPDALSAVLLRCPHMGGSLISFDAEEAAAKPGVEGIFELDGKVAVVARGYWQARQAANLVQVEWHKGPWAGLEQAELDARRRVLLAEGDRRQALEKGEAEQFQGQRFSADYEVPYLAHATMEPLNALAVVGPDGVEIWTGTQAIELVRHAVADATGYQPEQVLIHNSMLGGGFGRRAATDYVVEAARLAQHVGKPVKVIWSREDDIRHDLYRPNALARLTAKIDGDKLSGLVSELVVPSILPDFLPVMSNALLPGWVPEKLHRVAGKVAADYDPAAIEGIADTAYRIPYQRVDYIREETPVPVGYWRSVGHSQNAFFIESFIDELAHRAQRDPLDFRLALLPAGSRHRQVLELAAANADWGNPMEGRFQGLAVHESFGTVVAQVADVSVEGSRIRVHRVVCALDCGLAVNPDIVTMQMESGIVFGLTAALKGRITFRDGAVSQSNFHDYELLRMFEMPAIDVYRVPSQAAPTGVGEPGVPPIAAAVANAVFAATGQRLRSLPLQLTVDQAPDPKNT